MDLSAGVGMNCKELNTVEINACALIALPTTTNYVDTIVVCMTPVTYVPPEGRCLNVVIGESTGEPYIPPIIIPVVDNVEWIAGEVMEWTTNDIVNWI